MAKKKQNQKATPRVNPELEGFDIRIDSFGEIRTNYNIDRINEFLNKNVDDKKLRDRDDLREGDDEATIDSDGVSDDQRIKGQVVDMIEDELNNDADIEEKDYPSLEDEDDFDDFSIGDDDLK